ncbi:MAG: ABC transporter periplasmic protein [Halomonas sp. 54_146]|nr:MULTISPECIES: ABC transporter substrate-binding protein [unclassified Halomonas]KUJ87374.1 MAG: ABC transporter periplasmic protein [Halomonas sp. 54_146]HAA45739.1 ABC transporter substrate-binding protein [Halomonas sp.]
MLPCRLRYWRSIFFSFIVTLLMFNSTSYANEEGDESPQDSIQVTAPLTLESEVIVPDTLWRTADSEDGIDEDSIGEEHVGEENANKEDAEAPTMALTPAPPLEPPPSKNITLMLDWYLSPQHAALIIAQQRGYYAAQGLVVDIQSPADPSIAIKLLSAGEVDLALTRQPLLHLHAHDGAPITRIATLIETSLTAVIIAGEEQVGNDKALAELHYGYTTREGLELSIPRLLPRSVRQMDDFLPPENLNFDPARALREKQADAIADGFFHYLPPQLATEGITTHLIRFEALDIPRLDGLIVLANSDSLTRRADTWSRFTLALEEASHWIIDHPDAAWALLIATHPVLDNDINAAAWEDILRRMALSPAALDSRRYSAFEAYLQKRGIIDNTLPVSRLAVDPHAL